MRLPVPYCGVAPLPGELLARFNLDPILITVLVALTVVHVASCQDRRARLYAGAGWLVAAIAFVSPLCALSVALFSARIAQHMLLLLLAAPLIAAGLPVARTTSAASNRPGRWPLWAAALAFFICLWVWHMPIPYDATFVSTPLYWAMHVTLFGSGILLWRGLLHHSRLRTVDAFATGLLSSMQMGLLGAILTLAARPLFFPHLLTTAAWGLTPLQDQQLGGTLMWVPGILLFLWAAIRSLRRLWGALEAGSQHASRPAHLS